MDQQHHGAQRYDQQQETRRTARDTLLVQREKKERQPERERRRIGQRVNDHIDVKEAAVVPRIDPPEQQHEQQQVEADRIRLRRGWREATHEHAQRHQQHDEIDDARDREADHRGCAGQSAEQCDEQSIRVRQRMRRVDDEEGMPRVKGMRGQLPHHGTVLPEVTDPVSVGRVYRDEDEYQPRQRRETESVQEVSQRILRRPGSVIGRHTPE